MSEYVLTASNLHFAYQSKGENLTILSGTDLALARGETVAVVGASGTGKSTLLHILASAAKTSTVPATAAVPACVTATWASFTNFTTCCPNSAR